MHYFKLHHEVAQDPKVQMLPAETFRAWINMLCMASANKHRRGFLPEMKHIAYVLHVSIEEANRMVETLISEGLIDVADGGFTPHNWDERQGRVDLSTERSRRFREKHGTSGAKPKRAPKSKPVKPPDDATRCERVANADATETQRRRNATQLELERELELRPRESLSCDNDSGRDEVVVAGGTYRVVSPGHRETIEYALARTNNEKFAAVVADRGSNTAVTIEGRWDFFRLAIDALVAEPKVIGRPHGYCIQKCQVYLAHGAPTVSESPMQPLVSTNGAISPAPRSQPPPSRQARSIAALRPNPDTKELP